MEFDNSWRAVFNPAAASAYFSPPPSAPLEPTRDFSFVNAWWLAELARLVYRDDPPGARIRDRVLAGVGLTESRFFSRRSTECALVRPRDEAVAPAAALVFRGTDGPVDWVTNARFALTAWPQGGAAHNGFQRALDGVWPVVEKALDELAMPFFYAGHSLGGALAMLAGSRRAPLAVYSFGAPRVGDAEFGETLADVAVYRVVNRRDTVPRTPPRVPGLRYRHAGELRNVVAGQAGRPSPGKTDSDRRARFPPLPGGRRWHDPPGRMCDHAPVNYVACLERIARSPR